MKGLSFTHLPQRDLFLAVHKSICSDRCVCRAASIVSCFSRVCKASKIQVLLALVKGRFLWLPSSMSSTLLSRFLGHVTCNYCIRIISRLCLIKHLMVLRKAALEGERRVSQVLFAGPSTNTTHPCMLQRPSKIGHQPLQPKRNHRDSGHPNPIWSRWSRWTIIL